jgi:hypothetical protein
VPTVTLTMPRMGSKSDGQGGKPGGREFHSRPCGSTISQCQRGLPLAFALELFENFDGQGKRQNDHKAIAGRRNRGAMCWLRVRDAGND